MRNYKEVKEACMTTVFKSEAGKKMIHQYYEEILDGCPYEINRSFVETSFGKTHLIEAGKPENETVLMIHGSSSNAAMWLGDIDVLKEDYHVIAIDILGEPGCSDPIRLSLDSNEHFEWIREICMKMKLGKVHLIGNSLGGWLSLGFAIHYPDMVNKLILLAPSGLAPAKASFIFKVIPLMMMGDYGINKLCQLTTGQDNVPQEAMAVIKMNMKHFNPRLGSLPVYTDDEVKSLQMPVYYIAGADDALLKSKVSADRLKRLHPQSKIELIPNNGHVVFDKGCAMANFIAR